MIRIITHFIVFNVQIILPLWKFSTISSIDINNSNTCYAKITFSFQVKSNTKRSTKTDRNIYYYYYDHFMGIIQDNVH